LIPVFATGTIADLAGQLQFQASAPQPTPFQPAQPQISGQEFPFPTILFSDDLRLSFLEGLSGSVSQVPPHSPPCAGSSTSPPRKQLKLSEASHDSKTPDSVVFVSQTFGNGRQPCSLCNGTSSPYLLKRLDFVLCTSCYQDRITAPYRFWGHFFKLEDGNVVEVLAICRVNMDSYCRVLKTFVMGNNRDIRLNGTGELKSSGFVAVLPRINSKVYTFGSPETLFTHMSHNRDTPLFVSTICPDDKILLQHCLHS